MTANATLTSKGTTTIPRKSATNWASARRQIDFTLMPDSTVIMRVKNKKLSELPACCTKGTQTRSGRTTVTLMLGIDTNVLVRFLVQTTLSSLRKQAS